MSHILVGIDGSPASSAALAWALEEARFRALPLRLVAAWEIPALEYAGATFAASPEYSEEAEQAARSALDAALAQLGPDPGVAVEAVTAHGHPATVLLDEAPAAQLVVLGTRGRGGVRALVLGSVSQAVAHGCRVPLLMVPAPPDPDGDRAASHG